MICIRIFKTWEEAKWAQGILQESGIFSTITEDTFNNVPIQKFGVPARFRLKIEAKDLNRAAHFLADKLGSNKA